MNDIKDVKGTDNLIFKRNPLEPLNPFAPKARILWKPGAHLLKKP